MAARRETADELSEQISRHHALERDLERMQESQAGRNCPILAQVVMEECREAKIRRQVSQSWSSLLRTCVYASGLLTLF
jgi:hypothetical protein